MRYLQLLIVMVTTTMCFVIHVAAESSYLDNMPNGKKFDRPLGHLSAGGYTQFGKDMSAAGKKWNKALCEKDSDGDGQTNGQELGDPCCVWTTGATPKFSQGFSDPSKATSKTSNAKCDPPKPPPPPTPTPTPKPAGPTPGPTPVNNNGGSGSGTATTSTTTTPGPTPTPTTSPPPPPPPTTTTTQSSGSTGGATTAPDDCTPNSCADCIDKRPSTGTSGSGCWFCRLKADTTKYGCVASIEKCHIREDEYADTLALHSQCFEIGDTAAAQSVSEQQRYDAACPSQSNDCKACVGQTPKQPGGFGCYYCRMEDARFDNQFRCVGDISLCAAKKGSTRYADSYADPRQCDGGSGGGGGAGRLMVSSITTLLYTIVALVMMMMVVM